MPLITEIRALKVSHSEPGPGRPRGDGEWRLIILDNGRRLCVDAEQVARHRLERGEPIDAGLLATLAARDVRLRAREAALRLLAGRPRSAAEVGERLARLRVPKAAAQSIISDLAADGLLDDLAFARAWIARRTSGSSYGMRRIRWELRRKGVSPATIDRAVSEFGADRGDGQSEAQLALALARRCAGRYRSLPPDRRARRIAALLERRGFAPAAIARALRSVGHPATAEELDA